LDNKIVKFDELAIFAGNTTAGGGAATFAALVPVGPRFADS
jgi:hypothetical protein